MVTEAERAAFIREGKEVVELGEEWYDRLKTELEKIYPAGYFVIINVDNGECVVDKDEVQASHKAKKQFSQDARCFVRKIVGPYPHIAFAGCKQ